jgi:tetratricopeptide (TPR) repeat protein
MFVKPGKESWELNFYSDFSNWGTPEKWDDTKVVLKLKTPVIVLDTPVETMEISIENIGTASATLGISWDQVQVVYPFNLKTQKQVVENIEKVMAGPSASDYYRSAKYYLNEGLNPQQALDWINKAVALRGESAYWMTRVQAELFAKNGNYSQAIQAAKLSITAATKAGNDNYVKMNEDSIKQWSKK